MVPITGLASAQALAGIDVRPATGQLFALGYFGGFATNNAQLYSLSTTGVLTPVGGVLTLALGTNSNRVGFDFNPTTDRIRVTADNRANYRRHPDTGAIANTDGTLTYASTDANAGQTPGVGSSAYTNRYAGATTTTLYNLDEAASRLVTQNPPNDGTLNTVGALGESTNGNTRVADLDIYFNPSTGQNVAYMLLNTVELTRFLVTNQLYTVNLSTGATTAAGGLTTVINNSFVNVMDIAVAASTGAVTASRPAELATDPTLAPNPLAEAASLDFNLPRAATAVQLLVTDALGRTVDMVEASPLPAGSHTLRWARSGQAAGLYFFRLRLDGQPAGRYLRRRAAVSTWGECLKKGGQANQSLPAFVLLLYRRAGSSCTR